MLDLTFYEQEADCFYPVGHGRSTDDQTVHLFLHPAEKSLVRLDFIQSIATGSQLQKVKVKFTQVDLSVCNADGIGRIFFDTVKWWYRGSFAWDIQNWVETYTGKKIRVMSNGFPPSWKIYYVIDTIPQLDSLHEYQLFTADKCLVGYGKDAYDMADAWFVKNRDKEEKTPQMSAWKLDQEKNCYFNNQSGDMMLRIRIKKQHGDQ